MSIQELNRLMWENAELRARLDEVEALCGVAIALKGDYTAPFARQVLAIARGAKPRATCPRCSVLIDSDGRCPNCDRLVECRWPTSCYLQPKPCGCGKGDHG